MMGKFTFLFLFLIPPFLLFSQDPSFSQFYANRIYLNPAFAGIEEGMTLSGVSRAQWVNADSGFKTYGVTVELNEAAINSGVGISIYQDRQGLAQLNTTSIGLTYAYTVKTKKHNVHLGMQARWVEKKVDWTKITFSDQLDPVFGAIHPTSAIPILDRITYTDFDAGLVWRFKSDIRIGKKRFRDTRHSAGIAIHHLPQLISENAGIESFQNLSTKVSPRITFHAGSVLPISWFAAGKRSIAISPTVKFDVQGEKLSDWSSALQVLTAGAYLVYDGVYIGALYQKKHILSNHQNTNAIILAFGAYLKRPGSKSKNIFVGFSYDANTSGVGTQAGGVYEFAVRWNFTEVPGFFGGHGTRRNSKKSIDCFRFF